MRDSAIATIDDYLHKARKRLKVEEVEEHDIKKVKEHLAKAEEGLDKLVD